jgi:phospholipid N-methyltransferase
VNGLVGLKDDRLEIIKDSAIEMSKYLCGDKAHYIISGLPLANFSSGIKSLILNDIYQNLEQGGEYVQFQYAPRSYGAVKNFFRHVNVSFLFLNMPPAFIYECRKY